MALNVVGIYRLWYWTVFIGCGTDKEESADSGSIEEQVWWENQEEDQNSSEEDKSEEDKEDFENIDYEECAEDFDSTQACEGSWEETICTYDDLIWWCESGSWMSEEEK